MIPAGQGAVGKSTVSGKRVITFCRHVYRRLGALPPVVVGLPTVMRKPWERGKEKV
jgi:hypothetical protein